MIPKEIRDRLGLVADVELTIELEGGGIQLARPPRPSRQFTIVDDLPVFDAVPGRSLTDADVQCLRDADQR